ncbi:MAG TPA: sigma-70 family RNA polymerase sigma factor [Polyangia bacterium]|nr:sigma-70 family RNA polymerase sigma factor [Polyangia bacterium]
MTKPLLMLATGDRGKFSGPTSSAPESPVPQLPDGSSSKDVKTPTLDEIYRLHAPMVGRWVGWLTGRDVEAEDVVHEVFLVVHKRLHTLRPDASIPAWLYAITIRVVADRRRARRWRRWFGWVGGGDAGGAAAIKNAPSTMASPLEAIEQKEAKDLTYQILDELSEVHRTVLVLFELQGLSGEEIAAITGTSVPNVWLRLHRARKHFLRRLLALEAKLPGGRAR